MPYFAQDAGEVVVLRPKLENLVSEKAEGENWYALVDMAFDHGAKPFKLPGSTAYPIYDRERLQAFQHLSPTLFELAVSGEALVHQLRRLLHHCRGRPMLGFVRSSLPAATLRDRWQSVLTIRTEDDETYLLRFADTRVLPALSGQAAIWKRLAADLTAWAIIGRDASVVSLEMPTAPDHDDALPRLGNDGLSALLQAGTADAMAEYLGEYFPDLLAPRAGAENHRLLARVAELCAKHDIPGSTEQHALAAATLLSDGRLPVQPDLGEWLDKKSHWQGRMEDALMEFMEKRGIA